ncbi:MAG: hypothetical protein AAF799_27815 [Myxococcota bacterium]
MTGATPTIALLTDPRFEELSPGHWYTDNILQEDGLVIDALTALGIGSRRVAWSREDVRWSDFPLAVFRTTWDYFERFEEFLAWLDRAAEQTTLFNPAPLVRWNVDKHYLQDLEQRGVHTVPSLFIEPGTPVDLAAMLEAHGLEGAVLKPAVSGAARHTHRVDASNAAQVQASVAELFDRQTMILQPFQRAIIEDGETTLVVIDGQFTHALRKVAKAGDFRVQDDYGGTVHPYTPTAEEIAFAEKAMAACDPAPLYGRVDMIRDNDGQLAVMELELVEPELWFRLCPAAAERLAAGIARHV